jgi:hypothetical protein
MVQNLLRYLLDVHPWLLLSIHPLEDNMHQHGAMSKLISDRALAEIGTKLKDILRALFIDYWQSEPHHQLQNYAEQHYSIIKSWTNILLIHTGAPGIHI